MAAPQTLYQIANDKIRRCIDVYLKLAEQSKGLTGLLPEHLPESRGRVIVMAGLGVAARPATAEEVCSEWQRRQALSFDLETGITAGVYTNLRSVAETFYEQLSEAKEAGRLGVRQQHFKAGSRAVVETSVKRVDPSHVVGEILKRQVDA